MKFGEIFCWCGHAPSSATCQRRRSPTTLPWSCCRPKNTSSALLLDVALRHSISLLKHTSLVQEYQIALKVVGSKVWSGCSWLSMLSSQLSLCAEVRDQWMRVIPTCSTGCFCWTAMSFGRIFPPWSWAHSPVTVAIHFLGPQFHLFSVRMTSNLTSQPLSMTEAKTGHKSFQSVSVLQPPPRD